jgi:WD40 repeat protein
MHPGNNREGSVSTQHNGVPEREQRIDEVLGAYLEALGEGRAPDRQELLSRYPDLADELCEFFRDHDHLFRCTEPLRSAAQAALTRAIAEEITVAYSEDAAASEPRFQVRRLGDYELVDELGRGGMGIVYKARQVGLDRLVALKRMAGGPQASEAELRRFRNEAEAAAQLDHPHILPIHEVGEYEGLPYFTMKLVDGGNLAEAVFSGQWVVGSRETNRKAAQLLAVVARGVHHAHQHGVLHRDLKPSNILLDGEGRPYVSDFGLAKRLAANSELTQPGALIGTPSYMAPEQAAPRPGSSPLAHGEGQGSAITTATDVYGLGAVLYVLLTGRPPFRGETVLDTLIQVRDQEPLPPRRWNEHVHRDLEAICLKCLEKTPSRRYGSAEALAEDLERFLAGGPVHARPPGRMGCWLRWCKRNLLAASLTALSVALLLTVMGTLGISTYAIGRKATEAQAQRARAEEREQDMRRLLYVADLGRAHGAWRNRDVRLALEMLTRYLPKQGQEDLRGFEWYHLWSLCHPGVQVLRGHRGEVCHVAFSPDGRLLASSSWDGTIRLWDPATAQELAILRGHKGDVNWVTFAPDGKTLASGADDWTIKLWDVASRQELGILRGHTGDVMTVEFSPDGKLLASAGAHDKLVKLWDVSTRRLLANFAGHTDRVDAVAFGPDGKSLASSGKDATIKIWDVSAVPREAPTAPRTWSPVASVAVKDIRSPAASAPGTWVSGIAWRRDGRAIAMGCGDDSVKLWDVAVPPLAETHLLYGHMGQVRSVAFSSDGRLLASGGEDAQVRLLDLGRDEFRTFLGHTSRVWSVAFSPGGDKLASASSDATVRLWTLGGRVEERRRLGSGLPRVLALAFSPTGQLLLSGHADGVARLCNVETGLEIGRLETIPQAEAGTAEQLRQGAESPVAIPSVAWSPDGRTIALGGSEKRQASLWDAQTRQLRKQFQGRPGTQRCVSFSPDGQLLATGGCDPRTCWWNATTGERVREFSMDMGNAVCSMAFSPDGTLFVTGSYGQLYFWQGAPAQLQARLEGGRGPTGALAISPDGRTLASGHADGILKFWDLPTCQVRATVLPHNAHAITSAAFSPDSKTLAVGSTAGVVSLWNVASGQQLFQIGWNLGNVDAVAFSPDGKSLVAACTLDGKRSEVFVWSMAAAMEPRAE